MKMSKNPSIIKNDIENVDKMLKILISNRKKDQARVYFRHVPITVNQTWFEAELTDVHYFPQK